MTRPQPSFSPGALLGRPPQGTPSRRLRRKFLPPMVNGRVLRDSKAMLFQEVHESLRQGVPLAVALRLVSLPAKGAPEDLLKVIPLRESLLLRVSKAIIMAFVVLTLLQWFLATILTIFPLLAMAILAFSYSARFADKDGTARRLAQLLGDATERGLSLSQAMRLASPYFTEQEIAMAAGEPHLGTEAVVKQLSSYYRVQREATTYGNFIAYPIVMLMVLFGIASFIVITSIPKFEDIFRQMGAELPAVTRYLIFGFRVFFSVIAPFLIVFVFFPLLARALMNGTWGNKVFLAILVWVYFYSVSSIFFLLLFAFLDRQFLFPMWLTSVEARVVWGGILALATPVTMSLAQRQILWMESAGRALRRHLPILGGPLRAEECARFLSLFARHLEAGMEAGPSCRLAGTAAGSPLSRGASAAADSIDQGHGIGASITRAGFLPAALASRIAILEGSRDFPVQLLSVAEDSAFEAGERLHRAGHFVEVVSTLFIGLAFVLFVLLGIYLPLFAVPGIVGH